MMASRLACVGLVLLAACSGPAPEELTGEAIACGLGGATELAQQCRLERTVVEGAQTFVVRHPDGSFRRLVASADGQHLEAADGADASQSALKGDRYEVILGDSRYVIPVKANEPAR